MKLIAVKALKDFKLLLKYDNKENREFDVKPYLSMDIFQELKENNIFNAVKISFDTVEWPNSADLDPDVLYQDSVAV